MWNLEYFWKLSVEKLLKAGSLFIVNLNYMSFNTEKKQATILF